MPELRTRAVEGARELSTLWRGAAATDCEGRRTRRREDRDSARSPVPRQPRTGAPTHRCSIRTFDAPIRRIDHTTRFGASFAVKFVSHHGGDGADHDPCGLQEIESKGT